MEKKLNIFQKINAVMKEVKAVQKESKKVNGQYTFVSHDAVASALHNPMAEHGIVMIPTVAELVQDGNKTIVKMDISFINADDPADKFNVQYYGYGIDSQDKGPGKAISYAVKYALLKTFCLETGDDVEKDNIDHKADDVTPEMIIARKKILVEGMDKEDYEGVGKYLQEMSKIYKTTIDQLVLKYDNVDKFQTDFYLWKAKNQAKAM